MVETGPYPCVFHLAKLWKQRQGKVLSKPFNVRWKWNFTHPSLVVSPMCMPILIPISHQMAKTQPYFGSCLTLKKLEKRTSRGKVCSQALNVKWGWKFACTFLIMPPLNMPSFTPIKKQMVERRPYLRDFFTLSKCDKNVKIIFFVNHLMLDGDEALNMTLW